MSRFIGLVGGAGAGKDTVAAYLANEHAYKRVAFADQMKFFYGLAKGFRGTREEILVAVNAHKIREELISYGMAFRDIDPDTWVRALDKRVQHLDKFYRDLRKPLPRYVVTDIRFNNELDLIRHKYHGVIFKVTAPLDLRLERMRKRGDIVRDASFLKHESEQLANKVKADYTIDNSGSLDDLARQVDAIMNKLR